MNATQHWLFGATDNHIYIPIYVNGVKKTTTLRNGKSFFSSRSAKPKGNNKKTEAIIAKMGWVSFYLKDIKDFKSENFGKTFQVSVTGYYKGNYGGNALGIYTEIPSNWHHNLTKNLNLFNTDENNPNKVVLGNITYNNDTTLLWLMYNTSAYNYDDDSGFHLVRIDFDEV